jgi:PTH1 family peptidyl-tRNA hydrolase
MRDILLIAGLGNPGKEYEKTRHNAGFEAADKLADKLAVKIKTKKFNALLAESFAGDKKLIIAKPQLYMNRSGRVVADIAGFYRIGIERILVVSDDMALEPGRIRLRKKGSSGGHNGLADIISCLGSDEFTRLRVGIGKNVYPDSRDYVLGRPGKQDRELINDAVERAASACLCWVEQGVEQAMNRFNSSGESGGKDGN